MITKREWVFETNSSSMHSFTTNDWPELNIWTPDVNGTVHIYFWEFWWWYEKYHSAEDFASYIATHLFSEFAYSDDAEKVISELFNEEHNYIGTDENIIKFESIIKEQTGALNIEYHLWNSYYRFWYIDHQSTEDAEYMWSNCFDSIFKWRYLVIDNDNH